MAQTDIVANEPVNASKAAKAEKTAAKADQAGQTAAAGKTE